MKKLIFTTIVMLIALSGYSQTISGKENNGQSISDKPIPAVKLNSEGYQNQEDLKPVSFQAKSLKPEPAVNDISLGTGINTDQGIEKASVGIEAGEYTSIQAIKELAIPEEENTSLKENSNEKETGPVQNAQEKKSQPSLK